MSDELKPCPFCGSSNLQHESRAHSFVECLDCGCDGPLRPNMPASKDAWNTRAQPSGGALANEGAEPVDVSLTLVSMEQPRERGRANYYTFADGGGGHWDAFALSERMARGMLAAEIRALRKENSPTAPTTVVLPSLEDFQACVIAKYGFPSYQLCLLDGKDLQNLWVACLDRVKELNS